MDIENWKSSIRGCVEHKNLHVHGCAYYYYCTAGIQVPKVHGGPVELEKKACELIFLLLLLYASVPQPGSGHFQYAEYLCSLPRERIESWPSAAVRRRAPSWLQFCFSRYCKQYQCLTPPTMHGQTRLVNKKHSFTIHALGLLLSGHRKKYYAMAQIKKKCTDLQICKS